MRRRLPFNAPQGTENPRASACRTSVVFVDSAPPQGNWWVDGRLAPAAGCLRGQAKLQHALLVSHRYCVKRSDEDDDERGGAAGVLRSCAVTPQLRQLRRAAAEGSLVAAAALLLRATPAPWISTERWATCLIASTTRRYQKKRQLCSTTHTHPLWKRGAASDPRPHRALAHPRSRRTTRRRAGKKRRRQRERLASESDRSELPSLKKPQLLPGRRRRLSALCACR